VPERGRRRAARDRPKRPEHSHPGGAGAALGNQLARFSSMQGLSLLLSNILHYASIAVVARMLGPSSLGSFALLFFLTGLITQLIHLASKPGTIMRTFGVADDDDDTEDDDDGKEEATSARPTFTLGVGLVWCMMLSAMVIALAFAFRTQLAEFLLNDAGQADAVVFAAITGAVWAIFKLAEMVIWFEGRGLTYALVESARPAFNLAAIVAILSAGAGVKGAIVGQTIGTTTATLLCVAVIWGSFDVAFSFSELKQILKRGVIRTPIASSMWVVQNADSFILSRFLDHKDIGLYNLASRTGFVVAFLPQGFRMALRPIRKTAVYEAYRKEYGMAVANGQLLAYFYLITITAILAMVMGGEILIQIGGKGFESAAPLIPLTAAAMSMPALYRTVSMMAVYPNKRRNFVLATILVAVTYVGLMILLLSSTGLGIYVAPIAMLVAFAIPMTAMFLRSQLGSRPIDFPYLAMTQATVVAAALGVGFHFLHPGSEWGKLVAIVLLMGVWFASLFLLRIIPRYHWHPIRHVAMSAIRRGSVLKFDPEAALGSLAPEDRISLRAAVVDRVPAAELEADGNAEGARLVRLLRHAGRSGGVPVDTESERDDGIAMFLFADEPMAVRLRQMREVLAAGANAHDLRTLEDLRDDLAKVPRASWRLDPADGRPKVADGGRRPRATRA
jgi:O-antigen/teichoic acid export membrane protein